MPLIPQLRYYYARGLLLIDYCRRWWLLITPLPLPLILPYYAIFADYADIDYCLPDAYWYYWCFSPLMILMPFSATLMIFAFASCHFIIFFRLIHCLLIFTLMLLMLSLFADADFHISADWSCQLPLILMLMLMSLIFFLWLRWLCWYFFSIDWYTLLLIDYWYIIDIIAFAFRCWWYWYAWHWLSMLLPADAFRRFFVYFRCFRHWSLIIFDIFDIIFITPFFASHLMPRHFRHFFLIIVDYFDSHYFHYFLHFRLFFSHVDTLLPFFFFSMICLRLITPLFRFRFSLSARYWYTCAIISFAAAIIFSWYCCYAIAFFIIDIDIAIDIFAMLILLMLMLSSDDWHCRWLRLSLIIDAAFFLLIIFLIADWCHIATLIIDWCHYDIADAFDIHFAAIWCCCWYYDIIAA